MSVRGLSRRALLRGAGGVAAALPFLDLMRTRARAEGSQRFVLCFSGVQTGIDHDAIVPATAGPLTLTRGLAPLGGREIGTLAPALEHNPLQTSGLEHDSLLDSFSLVSGLTLPWRTGSEVPPAGRVAGPFHGSAVGPLLSGVRAESNSSVPRGPTADQIVASRIGAGTDFAVLPVRIQRQGYRTSSTSDGTYGRMSYRTDASGAVVGVPPFVQPSLLFDALFRRPGFVPDDPAAAASAQRALANEHRVAAAVNAAARRLRDRLGVADRRRLEQYFEEVASLEARLGEIPEVRDGACRLPAEPADPPATFEPCRSSDPAHCERYPFEFGWANEEARAAAFFDMVHVAFACDLTRVASVQFTHPQSALSAAPITGVDSELHALSHSGTYARAARNLADVYAWHVKHLARFAAKLKATPDGDGTLYDHTVIVLVLEGAWGYDPDGDRIAAHSTENMVALVAGCPSRLRMGQHIRGAGAHPSSVILSAMHAAGVDGGLGEITRAFDPISI